MEVTEMKLGEGMRKNNEKPRFDLLEPFAQLQKAKIFTKGAKKYAVHNWLQGMAWSKCYASALRHQAAWAAGQDYDYDPNCPGCQKSVLNGEPEQWVCSNHTGELHSALAAWNWDAITSYYKHFPQGDDRLHNILPVLKIGLDIDEVICDWVSAWVEFYGMDVPTSWFFDSHIMERFDTMRKNGQLDEFYLNLERKCDPATIPFEPHCYVTSRPVDTKITEEWLRRNGFPMRPVITVPAGTSKVEALKKAGVDIFVDDRYENYEELNRNGICCFLFDAPHNQRYNVGFKRIRSLSELV
jgi:hypothetical protein